MHGGGEWGESGHEVFCSVTDIKCKCFSDSEAKVLESSDSGG